MMSAGASNIKEKGSDLAVLSAQRRRHFRHQKCQSNDKPADDEQHWRNRGVLEGV